MANRRLSVTQSTLPASAIPHASAGAIGGVRVGSNLSIDGSGVLSAVGGGVTSHGALTGLSADDHTQYYNSSRLASVLAGYSLTSHNHAGVYQPVHLDLTAIAGLTPSNDDVLQRKAGAWVNRTIAQLKTDLGNPTAAGSGTEIQYKSGSAIGAIAGSAWDGTLLSLPKFQINVTDNTADWINLKLNNTSYIRFGAAYGYPEIALTSCAIVSNTGMRLGADGSIRVGSGQFLGWVDDSYQPRTKIYSTEDGVTYQRNGTAPQSYLISGTYTDINNYRRLYIKANDTSGDFRIGVEGAGTGANGNKIAIHGASGETVAISNGFTTVTAAAGGVIADFVYGTNGKVRLVYNGLQLAGDYSIAWGSNTSYFGSPDVGVNRSIAGMVEVNNGTTGAYRDLILRTQYISGTYTDSSNYFRGKLSATDGTFTVACETAGTGADNGDIVLSPCGTGKVTVSGNRLYFNNDVLSHAYLSCAVNSIVFQSGVQFQSTAYWYNTSTGAMPLTVDWAYVNIGLASRPTNATTGFVHIPTCAGTPTGTPSLTTGFAPLVIDSTNNKLYFYSNGAWRDAGGP